MYLKLHLFGLVFFSFTLLNCQTQLDKEEPKITYKVNKSEEEWKEELSPEEFEILRNAGTERPHTGIYNMHFEDGVYVCKGCGQPLFRAEVSLCLIVAGQVMKQQFQVQLSTKKIQA